MRTDPRTRLILAALGLSGCLAAEPPEPRDYVELLQQSGAQKQLVEEFKLSPDRVARAVARVGDLRGEIERMRMTPPADKTAWTTARKRANDDIAALLTPSDREAFARAIWKQQGADALLDPNLASKLAIKPSQQERLKALAKIVDEELQASLDRLPRVRPEHVEGLKSKAKERKLSTMSEVLTPEQIQAWREAVNPKKS